MEDPRRQFETKLPPIIFDDLEAYILLLLRSQLYVWGSRFWLRIFNNNMWPFFNPTIEVVTFWLREWCMLGVFLLSAFTHLGHECQDLLSLCDGMHVCTDYSSVYTLILKHFGGNKSQKPCQLQEKNPLYRRFRGGSNPRCWITQDSEPNTHGLSYSSPQHTFSF